MATLSYAIVFVSDMQRSIRFYRDVRRLPLRFESPEWTEFATQGVTLALHHASAPPLEIDYKKAKPAGSCQVGFQLEDIEDFHARMVAAGVPCLRPPTEEFGTKLATFADPDGLPFSVSQRRG